MSLMLHSELAARVKLIKDELDHLVSDSSKGVNREGGYLDAEIISPTVAIAATAESKLPPPTRFDWSVKSRRELQGVKPELGQCATIALQRFTTQDFMCYDGIRTFEEQKSYVAKGTSQTLESKHLPQSDGTGHAVDLVPVVGGIPKWDWTLIYKVAWAMDQAATYLGIANHIRWGGAWDRTLADFGGSEQAYLDECTKYTTRHPGSDFIDGPHFEWKE